MRKKGVLCMVLASVIFGIVPSVIQYVMEHSDISTTRYLWVLYLSGAFVSAAAAKLKGLRLRVKPRQLAEIGGLVFLTYIGTSVLLTLSYRDLPAGIATMLHFHYPVSTMVFMAIAYRQKLSKVKLLALPCALLGIALVVDIFGGVQLGAHAARGILTALLSGVAYAAYVIGSESRAMQKLDPLVSIFWMLVFAAVILTGIVIGKGEVRTPCPFWVYPMIVLSIVGTIAALCLVVTSVRCIGATDAALFNMLEPMTSMIVTTLVSGALFRLTTYLGCVLILASIGIIGWESRRQEKAAQNR